MSAPRSTSMSPAGVVTLPSPYSLPDTLQRLQAAISAKGLTIFADIDQQAAARIAGLTMPGAHLVLFGNPKAGTPVMLAAPEAGLDLPLKALLWERADGQVFVSYNAPTFIATRYELPEALAAPLAGIVSLLASVVQPEGAGGGPVSAV